MREVFIGEYGLLQELKEKLQILYEKGKLKEIKKGVSWRVRVYSTGKGFDSWHAIKFEVVSGGCAVYLENEYSRIFFEPDRIILVFNGENELDALIESLEFFINELKKAREKR